ncbi:MAG TPA: hypothetical protein VIK56_11145, partial [Rhodoferax sp.]
MNTFNNKVAPWFVATLLVTALAGCGGGGGDQGVGFAGASKSVLATSAVQARAPDAFATGVTVNSATPTDGAT